MVNHGRVVLLYCRPGPQAQLNAVALVGEIALYVHVREHADNAVFDNVGAEVAYHGFILGVIPGGENHRAGVHFDVFAALGVADIRADTAPVLHDELFGETAVAGVDFSSVKRGLHIRVDVDALIREELHGSGVAREGLFFPVVVLREGVKDGNQEVVGVLVGDGGAGFGGVVQVGIRRDPPVEHFADVVRPLADNRPLDLVGRFQHVEIHHFFDLLICPGVALPTGLHVAINHGVFAAAALRAAPLFDRDYVRAFLRRRAYRRHARHAAADNQYVRRDGFLHHIVRDVRRFAEPGVVGVGGRRGRAVFLHARGL